MFLALSFLAALTALIRQRPDNIRIPDHKLSKQYLSVFLVSFLLFLAGALVIQTTGLGTGAGNHFWNKVGVPYTWFSIVLAMGITFLFYLMTRHRWVAEFLLKHTLFFDGLVCILLWLAAAIIWSSTPINESKFNSGGYPPDYQPYPYSDAAIYDTNAHSMNRGDGMHLFLSAVDKPLYISFLAFGNLLAGSEFERLITFQILFMAVIPVFLYLLGKELYGRNLGVLAGLFGILREYYGTLSRSPIPKC
jgi:hypothetical protein